MFYGYLEGVINCLHFGSTVDVQHRGIFNTEFEVVRLEDHGVDYIARLQLRPKNLRAVLRLRLTALVQITDQRDLDAVDSAILAGLVDAHHLAAGQPLYVAVNQQHKLAILLINDGYNYVSI